MRSTVTFLPILWYNHIHVGIIFAHVISIFWVCPQILKQFSLSESEKLGITYTFIIPMCIWLHHKNGEKFTINIISGRYLCDLWLWLYDFSKFMKIGVNLCVSNQEIGQRPRNYAMKYILIYYFWYILPY